MNKKTSLVLIIITFVLLIVLASVLYPLLSKNSERQALVQLDVQEKLDELVNQVEEVIKETEMVEEVINEEENQPEESSFMTAPDFVAFKENQEMVHLSDYFGKPIVLNFWASWCPPCKAEMPDFNELYLELKDEVTFLMVNSTDGSRETIETASAYVKNQGFEFEVLYDTTLMASYVYQTTSIPQTFFINSKGQLVAYAQGMIDKETLRNAIGYIQ